MGQASSLGELAGDDPCAIPVLQHRGFWQLHALADLGMAVIAYS